VNISSSRCVNNRIFKSIKKELSKEHFRHLSLYFNEKQTVDIKSLLKFTESLLHQLKHVNTDLDGSEVVIFDQ